MEIDGQEGFLEVVDGTAEKTVAKRDTTDCSHRVIEKRRRDRINNSLMQISKLVPISQFNKKNSGKLEKAEILEVTVLYLTQQQLQQQQQQQQKEQNGSTDQLLDENSGNKGKNDADGEENSSNNLHAFLNGYKECILDASKFFEEIEELDVTEGRCHRLIQHLKKQVLQHEKKDGVPTKDGSDRVWENEDLSKDTSRCSSVSTNSSPCTKFAGFKRKNQEIKASKSKKQRVDNSGTSGNESQPERSLASSNYNSNNDLALPNTDSSNSMRNFMPLVYPNVPFFPTFPFAGAAPRNQQQQSQFPGYSFPQSTGTPYIPVALPQYPYIGMNVMAGFGIVNGKQQQQQQQQQNNGMLNGMVNGMPNGMVNAMPNGMVNGMVNGMPNGMANGFFPSMYSNGIHANILAMRPRDSGYESSDISSNTGSDNGTSPQSTSSDSCQSFSENN